MIRPVSETPFSALALGVLAIAAIALVFYLGVQPPNDAALWITLVFLGATALIWFGFERRRFKGPPMGDEVARLQAEIAAAEKALAAAEQAKNG